MSGQEAGAQRPVCQCDAFPCLKGLTSHPLAFPTPTFPGTGLVFSLAMNSPPLRGAQMSGEPDPISG